MGVSCINHGQDGNYISNFDGGSHFEELGVDARIILKMFIKKQGVSVWTRVI
jgi:hypothetical protein